MVVRDMSMDIQAGTQAKKFLEYIEAFSFANNLTNTVSRENFEAKYDGMFGNYSLRIVFQTHYSSGMRIKVTWINESIVARGLLQKDPLLKKKFLDIKKIVKLYSGSIDEMKNGLHFIVTDFENMNVLIDLLTGDQ